MPDFYKIILAGIFCCQVVFISCKTKPHSSDKNSIAVLTHTDSILEQFKHCFNDTLPSPKNYVSDYANIFTQDQEDSLNNLINSFDKQTTNQIAVVSFDTTMATRKNFDSLILKLANAWGVGKKDKNNGILIGICIGYKKIRIQNGKGIEKVLSDSETKQIVDSTIIPLFEQDYFFRGTLNGIHSIIQKLNKIQ